MKERKVICIYAGKYYACKTCTHSDPHDKNIDGEICTAWGDCSLDGEKMIKARCIYVTDKEK